MDEKNGNLIDLFTVIMAEVEFRLMANPTAFLRALKTSRKGLPLKITMNADIEPGPDGGWSIETKASFPPEVEEPEEKPEKIKTRGKTIYNPNQKDLGIDKIIAGSLKGLASHLKEGEAISVSVNGGEEMTIAKGQDVA